MNTNEPLIALCEQIAKIYEWVELNPLGELHHRNDDVVNEIAETAMENAGILAKALALAEQQPDEAIVESIRGIVEEGEWPDELTLSQAWRSIAEHLKEGSEMKGILIGAAILLGGCAYSSTHYCEDIRRQWGDAKFQECVLVAAFVEPSKPQRIRVDLFIH